MSDEALAAIVAAILGTGGLGGVLRWGFKRNAQAHDRATKSQEKANEALVEIAASNAVLVRVVDDMRDEMREVNAYVRKRATEPPQNKRAATIKGRTQTPVLGVRTRGGSKGEQES